MKTPPSEMLFALALLPLALAQTQVPQCKRIPGSENFPSLEVWAELNQTVQGRLIRPSPPGAVCFPDQPTYNPILCPAVQYSWSSDYFHGADPVSVAWNNFNNDTCLPLPARAPCSPAGYPLYVINATTVQDVKAGVDFARKHNIRLIVKNSGHDYVGRSSGGNALSIWVHYMKAMKIHDKPFRPQSCDVDIEGIAVTAAAGTQMLEAYQYTAQYNRTIVGGNGRTVALGGFITGGGHSIIAPHYGMAADRVLEMDVVTPTGEVLTVNECQNTDLFWALRGGGGSTFGILTSVTMNTIPSPQVAQVNFGISTPATNPSAFDMVTYVISKYPDLAEAGISGYPIIFKSVPNQNDGGRTIVSGILGKVIMLHTQNITDLTRHLDPIFKHINETWPNMSFFSNVATYPDYNAWYAVNYDPSPSGYDSVMGSRLLDVSALTANTTATKAALEKFSSSGQATMYIVSGKAVWEAKPRGGSTAVSPAWRKAMVHATTSISFTPLNATAKAAALAAADEYTEALRQLAPDMGAYVNEASAVEPNFQKTFWGENYPRLLEIKRKVDPDDVLWCTPCVGNERWELIDNQLCRVGE